jgi:hypothetical protein
MRASWMLVFALLHVSPMVCKRHTGPKWAANMRQSRAANEAAKWGRGRLPAPSCTLSNVTDSLSVGSSELDAYVSGVYGLEPDESLRERRLVWFSEQLRSSCDMLWEAFLPEPIRHGCSWPTVPSAPNDVFTFLSEFQPAGTLWIQRAPSELPCYAPPVIAKAAQPRFPAHELHDSTQLWVEVTRHYSVNEFERKTMWLFRARGSGLWFRAGRALVFEVDTGFDDAALNEKKQAEAMRHGYGALVRNKCEFWHVARRVELVSFPPVNATGLDRFVAGAFLNSTCPTLFSHGWPAGAHMCARCAWSQAGRARRFAHLTCAS